MFPWNIAKSAEAMLSRWAVKRVCKFVLKKKLGKFILGDIDLDQLDVQLSAGTLQLSDLALNVDYLNQKLGAKTALNVKEGSIGSLLVTMPWKGDGCRVEVGELELVLCLRGETEAPDGNEACSSGRDGCRSEHLVSEKQDHDGEDCSVRNNVFDVHEGVKTVAKMVKWLLTSFHVKVRKLIVAFDPCMEEGKNEEYYRPLVLRIAEAECGIHISDDSHSKAEVPVDNFLGFSYLTNFVTFEGAVLEFLQLNADNHTPLPSTLETTIGQWISECCPLNSLTPIITGKNGGFSGNLKLNIPWKNGSLDVKRVDGDAYLDPLEVRFHPGTIKSFICLWDILKNMDKKNTAEDGSGSTYYSAASNCGSSTLLSSFPAYEGVPSDRNSLVEKELASKALLSESHLIPDWVNRSQKKSFDEESDFGASVHQFFECFDGLRNSQSGMGSSGMWNWTCSVFSAITAATNLASGSVHIPSEQQHTETNFKATAAGISLWFSFIDETNLHHSCMNSNAKSFVDYGDVNFQDIVLLLQVSPNELFFETTVKHMDLSHHFSSKFELPHMHLMSQNDVIHSQVASMRKLRDGISSSLPPFCAFRSKPAVVDSARTCRGNYRDDVIMVPLLETSSACHCQVRVNSPNDFLTGPTSFSLKLPDLVFWVDINFISAVLDLFKEMGKFYEIISPMSAPEDFNHATPVDEKKTPPCATSCLMRENLLGDISVSDARIIIYSATEKCPDYGSHSSYLAVDLKKRTTRRHDKTKASKARPVSGFQEKYALASSCSIHVNLGDAIAYLIIPATKIDLESESSSKQKMQFLAHKIVSVADGAYLPVISMFWQEDPLTGPWIVKRAKILASAENIRNKDGFNGKSSEFASVSKVKDIEDFDHRSRQEMIVSSKFLIYARLPPFGVSLDEFTCGKLCQLLDHLIHDLSYMTSGLIDTTKEYSFNQQSVLVECDSLEISLTMEVVESVKGSIQCELPGSWERLRLKLWNFELFSVSNVGGIEGASFITVSHGDGDLLGSITGAPGQDFILISCADSAVGRGAGEGSNVLSPRHSGSDIVHFWDPENSLSSLSVTVRCGTITAVGGRLDWFEAFSSFLESYSKVEEVDNSKLEKDKESVPTNSSFVLNLVDIALSYEPYSSNPTRSECFGNEFCDFSGSLNQKVVCLLAASSLTLSNKMLAGSLPADYRIRVQDIGLLLSVDSGFRITRNYSVEHLRKRHYVKVAQEAHIEALLRTNCDNGCMWEVECSNSDIVVNTCHDTASGLMRLAGQVQQLFAPDMEESAVHLQNRWNIIQQTHGINENGALSGNCAASDSHFRTSDLDSSSPVIGNLMDQICDDAFQHIGTYDSHADTSDSSFHLSFTDSYLDEPCSSDVRDPYDSIGQLPITGSKPLAGVGDRSSMSQENIPQLIEEYFLSDLRPLSSLSRKSFQEVHMNRGDAAGGSNRWYESTVKVLDDHVTDANKETTHQLRVDRSDSFNVIKADGFDKIKGRILLKNMNVTWSMFGGSDWHDQKGVQNSSSKYGRDTQICIELRLSGIEFKYDALPDGGINLSRLCLTIRDIFLNDNSNDAAWKLVLGYYKSKKLPRRSSSKALKLELESIRPDPSIPLEEYRLQVSLLPMRLHLHQTQLDFLINFFGGNSAPGHISQDTIKDLGGSGSLSTKSINHGNHTIIQEALEPYFQKLDVSPVLIRVDYSPCHVDLAALRSGKYVELVNLVPWKGVELQLKHVQAVGIYGWNRVCETIIGEWLEDISQNQVHKLLKGLPPIRSLVAVGSGAAKLVTLPVRNYRKENRLVKGMQRGTIAFLRSISLEAIGLGVHLAAGAHEVLLQAEYILTTIPPSVPCSPQRGRNTIVKSNQPNDARQGIWQAYESISDGLSKSASALVQAPLKKYQREGGVGSALATAVKAAPAAALSPASATARALHCALLGVRNSLDPEHKKESLDKYLGKNQASEFM